MLAKLAPREAAPTVGQGNNLVDHAYVTAKILKAAARHSPFHSNCLQQSLVLWWLLRRQKIESELCLGVCKGASAIEAHAWVEYLGLSLDGADELHQSFTPLERAVAPVEVTPR